MTSTNKIKQRGCFKVFNKLSFAEKSKFYGAVAELEKHYSKGKVVEGLGAMADILDAQAKGKPTDHKQLEMEFDQPKGGEETKKKKRVVLDRKPKGHNKHKIEIYLKERWPHLEPQETILYLYYADGIKQETIGDMIGVNQRAVSQYLNEIPEKRKRKIMSEWGKKA
jgi:DNA-directed RNA polymerase specialized sigma subunit